MALIIATDTIEKFQKTTRYDIDTYLNLWVDFVDLYYNNLIDYFKGRTNILRQDGVKSLSKLLREKTKVDDVLSLYAEKLERQDFWNLVDYIDDISNRVTYIASLSKFLRSARFEGYNQDTMTIEHIMTDYDTPDSLASQKQNPQDEWTDIFIKNNVLETDYQAESGGLNLQLEKAGVKSVFLNSVIDNLIGDNIYGKDLDLEFVFEDDDLKVLSPRDTVKQSVKILGGLAKGDIPEFPKLGISKNLQVGSNLGVISIPFLTRELREAFSSDDTLVNFKILDVKIDGTALFVDYEVQTFKDFSVNQTLQI